MSNPQGKISIEGDLVYAGVWEDSVRPIENAIVVRFSSYDEMITAQRKGWVQFVNELPESE